MRYMLGTDTITDLAYARSKTLPGRLAQYSPECLCVSAITVAELEHGLKRLSPNDPVRRFVRRLLKQLQVLSWNSDCSHWYAELFNQQESLSTSVGAMDLMIAAHALAAGTVLVRGTAGSELDLFDAPLRVECWS